MINVKFEVITLEKQIQVIESFFFSKNQTSEFITDFFSFDFNKNNEIKNKLTKLYQERIQDLDNSCKKFQEVWNRNSEMINNELIKIFGKEFNFECIADVNLNPVWPRYLEDKSFDVNLDATEDFLLSASTHEIIHFIWFEFWKESFPNIPKDEYEYPNLSWLISEIAVEPIFRFSKLKHLSKETPAYNYFYIDKIDNKTIAEIANELYKESKNIKDFQQKIYAFFNNNKETKKLIK